MYDERSIAVLSGLNFQQRDLLGQLYSRLDEEGRVELHRRQRELLKDWFARGRVAPRRGAEAGYASLLVALQHLLAEQISLEDMGAPRKQYKQRLRSSLEKKYLAELIRLREEERLSWRQLADHFKKAFKKTVSHTYLKRIYDEYQAENS